MMTFALEQEQVKDLERSCRKLLEKYRDQEDNSTEQILSDMYREYNPDTTEDIAAEMAARVLGYVQEYDSNVHQAREDEDAWCSEKIAAILKKKKSCVDRCNTLYQVRVGMIASQIAAQEGEEAAKQYIEEHTANAFTEEEATEELQAQLTEELKKTLLNNGMLATILDMYTWREKGSSHIREDASYAIVSFGEKSEKIKAIIAMKAYLESGENGSLNGAFPDDTSLEQITYSTCASVDLLGLVAAMEKGQLSKDIALRIAKVIGWVLGAVIALAYSLTAGLVLASALGTSLVCLMIGIYIGFEILEFLGDIVAETVAKIAETAAKVIWFGAEYVILTGKKYLGELKELAESLKQQILGINSTADVKNRATAYTEPTQKRTVIADEEVQVSSVLA